MHLGVLSSDTNFQQCGWTTLANTVNTPTVVGKKVGTFVFIVSWVFVTHSHKCAHTQHTHTQPALTEPSLTLAVSLIECQLDKHGQNLPLVISILHFLAEVATTAKSCVNPPMKKKPDEVPLAYTTEQVYLRAFKKLYVYL